MKKAILPLLCLFLFACSDTPTDRLEEYMSAAKHNEYYKLVELSTKERRKAMLTWPKDSLVQRQHGLQYQYIFHHERVDDLGVQAWVDFSWIRSAESEKIRDSSRLVAHFLKEDGEWRMQYWEPKEESQVVF